MCARTYIYSCGQNSWDTYINHDWRNLEKKNCLLHRSQKCLNHSVHDCIVHRRSTRLRQLINGRSSTAGSSRVSPQTRATNLSPMFLILSQPSVSPFRWILDDIRSDLYALTFIIHKAVQLDYNNAGSYSKREWLVMRHEKNCRGYKIQCRVYI